MGIWALQEKQHSVKHSVGV